MFCMKEPSLSGKEELFPMSEEGLMQLRSDSIAWNAVGDNVVVLDLTTSTYFSTNATGTILWQMLECGAGRAEMIDALIERFGVDREPVERDVDAFLDDLERAQLLASEG
jgi:hypothetical protein